MFWGDGVHSEVGIVEDSSRCGTRSKVWCRFAAAICSDDCVGVVGVCSVGGEGMKEEGAQACCVGGDILGEVCEWEYEGGVEWRRGPGVYLPVGRCV